MLPFSCYAFSKYRREEEKGARDKKCISQTGAVTWTLGTKGVVLLLRHGLWVSKINKEKEKNAIKLNQMLINQKPHS